MPRDSRRSNDSTQNGQQTQNQSDQPELPYMSCQSDGTMDFVPATKDNDDADARSEEEQSAVNWILKTVVE